MDKSRSIAAIVKAARTIELSRAAQAQTDSAIRASLELLRRPAYPDDRRTAAEQ